MQASREKSSEIDVCFGAVMLHQSVLTRGLSRGRISGVAANARGEGSIFRESVGLQVSSAS